MNLQAPQQPETAISSLYALKALCVVFIVCLHSTLPGQTQLLPLLRTGVPLFFMISGYFTFSLSRKEVERKVLRHLKKTSWIIVYANAVYFLLALVMHLNDPTVPLPLTDLKSWILLLVFGNGVALPLWYLTAYFETLLIFWLFLRIGKENWLLWMIPVLLALNLAVGMYGFLFGLENLPYVVKINFITNGIPCFCLGYALHKYKSLTVHCGSGWIVAGTALLALCESILLRRYAPGTDLNFTNATYLMTLPLAAVLFIWCLHHPTAGKKWMEKIGKKYSRDIYLYHYLFFLLLFTYVRTRFIEHYSFLVILPCSLLLAVGLDAIRNSRPFQTLIRRK